VFVSVDIGMMGQLVKMEVVKMLQAQFGPDMYRHDNVVLSATHTHQGPGGYLQYMMFSVTSFGFIEDSFQVILIFKVSMMCFRAICSIIHY